MRLKKRGQDPHPMNMLVVAAVLLIVAIILFIILKNSFSSFSKAGNCNERGGHCATKAYGVGCPEGEHEEFGLSGCDNTEMCCMVDSITPGTATQFSAKEQEALQNAIILTLNKDTKPIADRASINLKAGSDYEFHIRINDQLLKDSKTKDKLGFCAVYVINSKEQGKKYLLNDLSKKDAGSELIVAPTKIPLGSSQVEISDCIDGKGRIDKIYKPSALDAYRDLTLYIILFDNNTKDARKKAGVELLEREPETSNEAYIEFESMYSNTDHWLAMRAYRLNVEPVVKISGLSGEWVTQDDVTIACDECNKIGLKLVRSDTGNFEEMLNVCSGTITASTKAASSGSFQTSLDYVSGTVTKTTGIPLNIDIGGFRLPSQQKIMYVTDSKPIVVDAKTKKATVKIDRATILKTFQTSDYKFFVGETTYLCAEAIRKDGSTAYGVSETPLKIDVLPPYLNPNDIKVIYPDPITSTQATTPYYYRTYPVVRIPDCYDYGQSGCAKYDYYIHTGNFINLGLSSTDIKTGIGALLLTEGLNALLNKFASTNAINTLCPFITSTDYISNTHQEIRFREQGQGIICIRVSDKAGNSQIVYTSLWTPEEMFRRIVANQTQELMETVTS